MGPAFRNPCEVAVEDRAMATLSRAGTGLLLAGGLLVGSVHLFAEGDTYDGPKQTG